MIKVGRLYKNMNLIKDKDAYVFVVADEMMLRLHKDQSIQKERAIHFYYLYDPEKVMIISESSASTWKEI